MSTDPRQQHIERGWNAAAAGAVQAPAGLDSIHPSIESERGGMEWNPVPLTQLGESEPTPWIMPGVVALGMATLFTGLWKSGKTTFISWMLVNLLRGGGLIPKPTGLRVLVITEESKSLWRQRRDKLGLDDSIELIRLPFAGRPSDREWTRFVTHVAALVRERGYGLVVFDTISAHWSVTDENDAARVTAALQPLRQITELDAALLLVHHPRKSDAAEGQASRGSGALPGWADVIVEMRRFAPSVATDRRRVLRAYGRPDDIPAETVIELRESEGYVIVGTSASATQGERLNGIEATLRAAGKPLTKDEIDSEWAGGLKPGNSQLAEDLRAGADGGRWSQSGKGIKGDPFRYALGGFDSSTGPLLSGQIESDPPAGPAAVAARPPRAAKNKTSNRRGRAKGAEVNP